MSDIADFNNQHIQINDTPETNNANQKNVSLTNNEKDNKNNDTEINNQSVNTNTLDKTLEREVVVINGKEQIQTSFETINKTWIDKFFCCFTIFKKYFQITSDDFILRFLNSLIPFNNKFQNLIKDRPDLYGPIWIYSSLILIISATGSLTRTLQGHNNKNFFQEFVPIAGVVIYGVGFGLPLFITFLMKIFGASLNFIPVICTYGYSFSIFLPISIVCVVQVDLLQWVALIYAVFSSTSLLVVNYYKQMGEFSRSKKMLIISLVLIAQLGLLLLFKLYFFQKFSKEVMAETIEIINNGTTTTSIPETTVINPPSFDDNINNSTSTPSYNNTNFTIFSTDIGNMTYI
jgi:hypothetical protein